MAESYSQQYRGKITHVYLGEGRPEPLPKKERNPDTLFNKYMQELFDVVVPEAAAERADASQKQAELATTTASELQKKSSAFSKFKEHKDMKRFLQDLDTEWRGRELPKKLDRFLVYSVVGGVSSSIDFLGDELASRTILNEHRSQLTKYISLKEGSGNRKALETGWEMITDKVLGGVSDKAVQAATNKDNVAFVSPLSEAVARIGNVASLMVRDNPLLTPKQKKLFKVFNALNNPSSIEAGMRALSSIAVVGAPIERTYIALNKQLLRGEGLFPFGFDLALAMMVAKNDTMEKPKAPVIRPKVAGAGYLKAMKDAGKV